MKEPLKFATGLVVDCACIGAMVMQVMHPGTYWDYLGNAGSFLQGVFIWTGVFIIPLVLSVAGTMRERTRPFTDAEVKLAQSINDMQIASKAYRYGVLVRELAFCLLFSSMGWIWYAAGNLLALYLLDMLWSSPKVQPTVAA
jgi:hypothetical protein